MFVNHFGVNGGSKLGFWMKMGFENRSFGTAQMSVRSSEPPFAQANNPRSCPEIVSASSLKRKPSER